MLNLRTAAIAIALLSFTPGVEAAETIIAEKYDPGCDTLERARKYPGSVPGKTIRKYLNCKNYKIVEKGATDCRQCGKSRTYQCKAYVIAYCK